MLKTIITCTSGVVSCLQHCLLCDLGSRVPFVEVGVALAVLTWNIIKIELRAMEVVR